MASSLDAKQMKRLLQSISNDPPAAKTIERFDLTRRRPVPRCVRRDVYKIKNTYDTAEYYQFIPRDRKASGSFDAELRATTITSQIFTKNLYSGISFVSRVAARTDTSGTI
jgi:hypothetical protein